MTKKIKIVISDLHIGGGRVGTNGSNNPFEEFHFDRKFVEFINYYCAGDFKEADVELILNGDFLNFLQVDYRGHYLSVITETIAVEKLKKITQGHPDVFAALSDFARLPNRAVTYVIGNHDQCMLWPATRNYLNNLIGAPIKYVNIAYNFDGVHVEHGHMHEPANRLDPKKFFVRKGYAEPILNMPLGSHFFVDFVLGIKAQHPFFDKVRPFKRMLRWYLWDEPWFTFKTSFKLLSYFLGRVFAPRARRGPFSLKKLFQVAAQSAIFPDLGDAARKILESERFHTVVFGHTNVYQYRQFGLDKEYFNTGSWSEITSLDVDTLGRRLKLTYVIIEYPEDEGGRPRGRLKEWRGFHRIEEDVAIS